MRYNDLLLEAQKYESMFTTILAWMAKDEFFSNYPSGIAQNIKWAKQKLKKNDRIVWYLRQYRIYSAMIIKDYYGKRFRDSDGQDFNEEMDAAYKLYDRYIADAVKYGAERPLGTTRDYGQFMTRVHDQLDHFISLPIATIQNYVFTTQTPNKVFEDFKQFEKEWQAEQDQMFEHEDEEVVMEFPDGMMWVNLNRASCEQEASSMGHCGNSPRSESSDKILSLRKLVTVGEQKYWHPFLTFILDAYGFLTEMKGRNNDKPAARYHPYIVALLRNPIIDGIKGGGYMPENNFDLDDLDPEVAEELIDEKPMLLSPPLRLRKEGITPENGDTIAEWIGEQCRRTRIDYDEVSNSIITDEDWDENSNKHVYDYFPDALTVPFNIIKHEEDREAFVEDLILHTKSSYKDLVAYRFSVMSSAQRAYMEKVIALLVKNNQYAPVRQRDLFGAPERVLDIEEDFIRLEAEALKEGTFPKIIGKLSEIVGWKHVAKRVDNYRDTLENCYAPSEGRAVEVNGSRYLGFTAHDLKYMEQNDDGDDFDYGREIEQIINSWGENANFDASYFDFKVPSQKNEWEMPEVKGFYRAFIRSFFDQSE